jgi:hypothetical protein
MIHALRGNARSSIIILDQQETAHAHPSETGPLAH